MTTLQARLDDPPFLAIDPDALHRRARTMLAIGAVTAQVLGVAGFLYVCAAGPGLIADHASTVPVSSPR